MSIMGKMVRIPAGNTTNEHYNFVVAKPLVNLLNQKIFSGVKWLLNSKKNHACLIIMFNHPTSFRQDQSVAVATTNFA